MLFIGRGFRSNQKGPLAFRVIHWLETTRLLPHLTVGGGAGGAGNDALRGSGETPSFLFLHSLSHWKNDPQPSQNRHNPQHHLQLAALCIRQRTCMQDFRSWLGVLESSSLALDKFVLCSGGDLVAKNDALCGFVLGFIGLSTGSSAA